MPAISVSSTHWPVALSKAPKIRQIGIGFHGHSRVERYHMQELWCIHLYRYHAQLRINGEVFLIQPGTISITPPEAVLEYHYRGHSVHAYAHFEMPDSPDDIHIAAFQQRDEDFIRLNAEMEHAIGYFPLQPARATARLWDILWELVEAEASPFTQDGALHPAVAASQHAIELRLAEPISIADLAREVNLSHNHLTRLFQDQKGCSIATYIRRRRMERARHLLLQSTLPIKAIAAQVGIHDLHAFNKTVRRELGASPRQLREEQK